jgi:hypothetical protein
VAILVSKRDILDVDQDFVGASAVPDLAPELLELTVQTQRPVIERIKNRFRRDAGDR